MNINNITYMWNFKPNEKQLFPQNVINNNLNYIGNNEIIKPNDIENLLLTNDSDFPCLLMLYNIIPHWVVKADLGRLLSIYYNSGLYADADCFIIKQLDNHKEHHNIILFIEHICNTVNELGSRECKNPENVLRIANYCFGAKIAKHPFLKEVIDECIKRLTQLLIIEKKTDISDIDILWLCGPDVITTIYHKSKHNYPDIFLYDNTFLKHMCYGSWRK